MDKTYYHLDFEKLLKPGPLVIMYRGYGMRKGIKALLKKEKKTNE